MALALYDLLKGVNRRHATIMVVLILVSVPIAFLNELNAIAALVLVRGSDFLSVFEKPQRDALAMLFVNLHGHGLAIAGIFCGRDSSHGSSACGLFWAASPTCA